MEKLNINKITNDLLEILSPRYRKVISDRFGLFQKEKTLQEIGDKMQITRERVRQIENQAIKKVKKEFQNLNGGPKDFVKFARAHLEACGGVKEHNAFMSDIFNILKINKKVNFLENKVKFILLMSGEIFYEEETQDFNAYWYLNEDKKKEFLKFVAQMKKFLENSKKNEVLKNKLYLNQCKDLFSCHLLSIPKFFAFNALGDFGLKKWPEISPRSTREKAYLVLQKIGKPLHFREIAKNIYKHKLSKKVPHFQTVHNELIKDKRFVLVGRGIYALKEFGFEEGTVKDVIYRFIKKHGPLTKNEIMDLIKTQRIVKENTVILNLYNKKHFKKLKDGRFDIVEV